MSDELKAELDPELKDLKDKDVYDIPSLRFRVLGDREVAVGDSTHTTFNKEDEQDAFDHLHHHHHHRQVEVLNELKAPNTRGAQRWRMAFKDISKGGWVGSW